MIEWNPHAVKWYGFSPVWILFKCSVVIKVFSHWKHIYSLTPVCIFWCTFKFCSCEKLFPQKEHECGFYFEWTFRWLFRFEAHTNVKPHWSHSCSFSPVWMFMWILRLFLLVKHFPHWQASETYFFFEDVSVIHSPPSDLKWKLKTLKINHLK